MRSLQSKLGSGLTLSLVAIFTALWFLVSFSIQYLAEEYIASRLRHDAEMLLSTIYFDKVGTFRLDESTIDPIYSKPFSGHYYFIASGNQTLSSRSLWDRQLSSVLVRAGDQISNYQDGPDNQLLLVSSNGFIKQGYTLSVTMAEDLNPVKRNIRQFQIRFAITAIVMLLLLVVLQALILRHSLKSLSHIRDELQSLQQGETSQLNANTPAELRPLVNEINHLLDVMDQRLRRSRDALGDLAHAIKRPLTIIQQLLDKSRNALPTDLNEGLVRQVKEISQLSDRILKRARLAGHSHSGARFSFSQDLPALIETLDLMHSEKSIATQVNVAEEVHYPIDREDMLELLGNLLDNAYKWANQRVDITITMNTELTICIEDDGPGADPSKFQQLDKRGIRLDETKQGYGFGLGIASDMVREYRGTLSFSISKTLGGFRVDITLPVDGTFINSRDK
ncbi:MAG: two-component system sensor histidine kinase CarS [Gammaproteobacteria bacterium]|nr:MAG: two-component system sensor histidine kinase CarS [Gammaproteobacteria bacterium]